MKRGMTGFLSAVGDYWLLALLLVQLSLDIHAIWHPPCIFSILNIVFLRFCQMYFSLSLNWISQMSQIVYVQTLVAVPLVQMSLDGLHTIWHQPSFFPCQEHFKEIGWLYQLLSVDPFIGAGYGCLIQKLAFFSECVTLSMQFCHYWPNLTCFISCLCKFFSQSATCSG